MYIGNFAVSLATPAVTAVWLWIIAKLQLLGFEYNISLKLGLVHVSAVKYIYILSIRE